MKNNRFGFIFSILILIVVIRFGNIINSILKIYFKDPLKSIKLR